VEYLHPAGGQQGTTVSVTAGGKFDAWPVKFWADHPGLKAEAAAEKGKLAVTIDKSVPPGPHLVRLYDATGPSTPRVFVVGTLPESLEAEPNDEVSKAQAVDKLPLTISGRLEKSGDVDSFAVKLEAGQSLSAAVQSRRLGAPVDPLLHLYDTAGNQLAFVHDGLGLDPLLVYRAERAGTYVVRVAGFKFPPAAEVRLTGEAAAVYRVTLAVGPVHRYATPAGIPRGAKGVVSLFGWDGEPVGTREVDASAAPSADEVLTIPSDGAVGSLRIELGDGVELTETDAAAKQSAAPLSAPVAVTGRLERDGEEDGFRFAARKGERINLAARAAALASPVDLVLRIEDDAGKELARNDDDRNSPGDPRLDFTATADGTYRAVVSDLFRRGGHEYVYRLSLRTPVPTAIATTDADEYRVGPGKTASIKLTVARQNGHAAPLVAVAAGLPPGVTATSAEVPEKGGEVVLTLSAAKDAKPAAGPLRIMLLGTDPQNPAASAASASLKKDAGQEMILRTDALWLTVPPG
jgi:hypothetical protein